MHIDERTKPYQRKPYESVKPLSWQEGEYTVTRGSAWSGPGCHNGCGVLLYTDNDGKLAKVEGDPENPFNQGRLCSRCLDVKEVVDHPDRLKYPMKRAGERGEDKWERISWNEAYDLIESKFREIIKDYGAESIIFGQGTGRDIMSILHRLAYAVGSPNWGNIGLSGNACYLPRVAACQVTAGAYSVVDCAQYLPDRYNDSRWEPAECLIIWGNNPVVSNGDGFFGHWVIDLMRMGTKIIVVDPRVTWLATRSEYHLQLRPGTDGALVMGMLNVIIQEDLYDHDFVENWTYGFDELAERVKDFTPERVEEITWVPAEEMVAAARMFAAAKPGAIQWGLAIDQNTEGVANAMAIQALWTITGNVNVPGGMICVFPAFGAYQSWLGSWGIEDLPPEQAAKRIGPKDYPLFNYGFLSFQCESMTHALETGEPYPIKAAWIQTNNTIACQSTNPKHMYELLDKLDFIVCVDVFKTPTIVALADVVLPAAMFPERDGIRCLWYHIQTINKVTDAPGEAKSDFEINLELGKRFNPEMFPWDNVQDMFSAMIEGSGMTFEELQDIGGQIYPDFEYRAHEKGLAREDQKPGFATMTGRIELSSTLFDAWGLDPLPYYKEPRESPVSTPDVYEKYPLILTSGARHWASFHSEHRQIKRLRALHPDCEVAMNPETGAKYGIEDGDMVWIENELGKCQQRARFVPTLDPRVINADHGWWFPEEKAAAPHLFGVWKSNANQLIPGVCGPTGFGANIKANLCRIRKVKEGEQ